MIEIVKKIPEDEVEIITNHMEKEGLVAIALLSDPAEVKQKLSNAIEKIIQIKLLKALQNLKKLCLSFILLELKCLQIFLLLSQNLVH
jgi:hypothetical protein